MKEIFIRYPPRGVTHRIIARARDGTERAVYFAPDTLEACAGAMEAHTGGNRRDARHLLCTTGSYSATNSAGDMLRAERVGKP